MLVPIVCSTSPRDVKKMEERSTEPSLKPVNVLLLPTNGRKCGVCDKGLQILIDLLKMTQTYKKHVFGEEICLLSLSSVCTITLLGTTLKFGMVIFQVGVPYQLFFQRCQLKNAVYKFSHLFLGNFLF